MSVFRPGLFKGKVALVTGGGSGIGNLPENLVKLKWDKIGGKQNFSSIRKSRENKAVQISLILFSEFYGKTKFFPASF